MASGRFTCVRTPEADDGPFYYESSLLRRALAENRKGLPLKLRIAVAGATIPGKSCPALSNAVVDVWHTDADGLYSNVGADMQMQNTVGMTFMRGHQLTDQDGSVEFDSVVPGWEIVPLAPPQNVFRRTVHIHVKVFYENKVATTQLYFPDEFLDDLYANVDPYRTHKKMPLPGSTELFERVRNGQDPIFQDDKSVPMSIRREGNVVVADAMIGVVTSSAKGIDSLFR
jgi:protocatechuate 3,4-dioxygenase beta subunit